MDDLSKPVKILIGIATIWPPIFMFLFMFGFFLMRFVMPMIIGDLSHMGGPHDTDFIALAAFIVLMALYLFTILLWNGLMVFYIVHLFMTKRITEGGTKALWAVLIFLANILVMPVYWYLYIWQAPASGQKSAA
jgi:hypothetical protein